ncbi:MAG: YfhO family protein, partial [Muribaculaceae bacterium]|nr:YfhO family protein [Muribaculaceae bacterium]
MTLLQIFSQDFGGEEGTSGPVYAGAIIVALFLFGAIVVGGPLKWALLILTVLSVFLSWGRHMMWFTDLFIDWVPMYNRFRTVESILVIAEFTLPLLAVLGLRELFAATTADKRKAMLRPLAWSFGICLAFCLLAVIWPGLYGQAVMGKGDLRMISLYTEAGALPAGFSLTQLPEVANAVESIRLQMVSADALRSMLFIGIAMITLLAFIKNKISAAVTVAIVGIAAMTDLYGADKRYINSESFSEPRQAGTFTPSAADRAILADTDPHYRVLDVAQFSAAAPSFFHKSIGGYHAAKLTRYQDLIERQIIPGLQSGNLNAINMLNAKYIITDPNAAPVLNDSALGNAWFVGNVSYVDSADDEMAALDVIDPATEAVAAREFADVLGAATPADSTDVITLTDYAPDRLTYRSRSASGGVAVFSEVYFPWGWKATVDGEETPVARVNYVLRAMRLPAGEHEVVMTFDPRSIHVTDTVATASASLIY